MILTKEDLEALAEAIIQPVTKAVYTSLVPEFERIDKKFVQIANRFDQLDSRIDQLEMRVNLLGRTLDDYMEVNATEHQEIKEMIRDLFTRVPGSTSSGKYRLA